MAKEINPYIMTNGNLKKRVLFVITQSEMGGAQRFLFNLLTHLDKDRYEAMVAIGNTGPLRHSSSEASNGDLFRALKDIGIPTHRLSHLIRNPSIKQDLKAVFELRKLIKDYRADIVFLNSSKAGFIGSAAARFPLKIRGAKVIYRIGGWSFNDPNPHWKKWLWIILERLSARWKDIIIVNNKHDLEQAHTLKIRPREKIVIVYNGLDVYKMGLLPKEEARTQLSLHLNDKSISAAERIVGTIANFYPPKGLEYLIEAAEHFKNKDDVVFVVIGDGQERTELENLIKQKGLQKKVLLVGQVPEAHKLLSAFDIFVLSSVKEGFPWVVIEAMAAKLPVVATRVGAVPEIIEDSKNGFVVEPARPEKIAEKVQDLLNDDRLRQELGIQAHQTVLFKFELDKMVEQIEELL